MNTNILTPFILFLGVACASCQDKSQMKITVSVADDLGLPVQGASVQTSVFDYWQPGTGFGKDIYREIVLLTDDQGKVVIDAKSSRCEQFFLARKSGYYEGIGNFKSSINANGRWEPWNPTIKVELKRVLKPIPLVAKLVSDETRQPVALPADKVSYDFEVGDWTAPHGKGKIADIVFLLKGKTTAGYAAYEATFTITFSNPKDGLVFLEREIGFLEREIGRGTMRMPYQAPETGYLPERKWRKARVTGPTSGIDRGIDKMIDDTKLTDHYFLRVRTKLDEKGEIVSAHYAKVQGGFLWYPNGFVKFQYYFNPTPNDRNLEFDISRNLLKVLPGQEVKEP